MRNKEAYYAVTHAVHICDGHELCPGHSAARLCRRPYKAEHGEYTDDHVIAAKVKSALIADPDVKGTQVDVEVFKGVVQLSGFVNNANQVRKAATIASNVGGVTEVRNTLQVR